MNFLNLSLVLASSATHAYWNFLVKRNAGGNTFIGLSKVMEVAIFAPVFLFLWTAESGDALMGASLIVIGAGALAVVNYIALAKGYETGDLSIVYPIARGATLLFLPLFGFLAFQEHVSAIGWMGIASVMIGIASLSLPAFDGNAVQAFGRTLRSRAIAFALLAALATAGYTILDKRGVQRLPMFIYFYAYTAATALLYVAYLAKRYSAAELNTEWRTNKWPIVQVAVLNTASYLLVLVALRSGTSSYVLALRQLSIGIGVLLGWKLLGEALAIPKQVGVVLLVAGCALVAAAR